MLGITNPAEKYFKDGLWTFDGTVWRPQNQLIAYRDVVRGITVNSDAAAGSVYIDIAAVPAGQVHVINSIIAYDNTTAVTFIYEYIKSGGSYYYLNYDGVMAMRQMSKYIGTAVLRAGENIGALIGGVTLHDVLVVIANGYYFKTGE